MFDPKAESTRKLIEKYKALFEFAIKQQEGTSLSTDQIKAIGKRVLYECIETAMNNQKVPLEERDKIMQSFEELIQRECPNMIFDTTLEFTDDGFSRKE